MYKKLDFEFIKNELMHFESLNRNKLEEHISERNHQGKSIIYFLIEEKALELLSRLLEYCKENTIDINLN